MTITKNVISAEEHLFPLFHLYRYKHFLLNPSRSLNALLTLQHLKTQHWN